ncbi:CU044_5270 family protein [Nonomuraea aurantiaca]|uniref:CU044_5270 family protein n=1 Tax=Nonomuraea aurantiaca TaxID=2878562 RepID=UPI001CD94BE7|nr:CU044_5270 family protein [Nonomuraea aurantiaca]MCA2221692.1 CU044_5270 family protein [Nonomuraea aurantiaca]
MDDEIRTFADGRPAAPPYPAEARAKARDRLLREAREGRGFRFPKLGWQAAAAFGVTVALVGGVAVALSAQQPKLGVATSAAQSAATQSAAVLDGDLRPKPGQFIMVASDTMYSSFSQANGKMTRYLYRTHREIWQSADASADGLLLIAGLAPKPWPGEPLPKEAQKWKGESWMQLASCPARLAAFRTDHAYLSTLPPDPALMRSFLYKRQPGGKGEADRAAFVAAGDLVRETYMPKAQRDALFEAAKEIPGVQVADGVEDSAGRQGVALGRESQGILEQLIFDRDTHMLLGERHTVVDAKAAGAPVDSVLALTAQLKVSVVDRLPEHAPKVERDDSCTPQPGATTDSTEQPTALPTDEATDLLSDGPSDVPSDGPSDVPSDGSIYKPTDGPTDEPPAPVPTKTG